MNKRDDFRLLNRRIDPFEEFLSKSSLVLTIILAVIIVAEVTFHSWRHFHG